MKYLKIRLIHLLLAFSNLLLAQQYPVNVSSNLVTPMPSKLSNFYADNVQKFFVTLTNKDLTNPSIPVKLKLTFIGSSVQIVSKVGSGAGIIPILLDAGVPQTLTQQDLTPYFDINNVDFVGGFSKSQYISTGVLPEGNYAVSVQVLDYYNNRPLSKPFSVYGSVFFSQPPILLLPQSNNTINGQQTTVIPFNWVPAHLNNRDVIAGGFKYIFTLKEILNPSLNINQTYATATTRLVEEVTTTQFMLNTLVTPLLSGRKYAWTVQVKANNPEAQYTLANDGISQVWGFTYDDNCQMPINISSIVKNNNLFINWTNSTFGKVSSVRYKETNGVEYEKQLIPNASTVSLDGLLFGKSYDYSLVVKCGTNTLVTNPRSFTVPPKSSAVKVTLENKVYWSVQEGQKSSDYTATGFDLKRIFQGTSTKTIKTLIPNHKLGLSAESNDVTVTLNTCVGTAVNQKALKGAKVELWENEDIIESTTTDGEGAYKIAIDTGRIIDNSSAKYYLKFSRPDNLIGRDSINLSGLRTGKDILNNVKGKLIKLFSSDYLVIHPVVYVGVNQVAALQKKAGGKVEVFIHTNDSKSLPNRVLGYVENIPTNESYNGESYILIGTLDDVNAFLPIETFNNARENLLFKVSLKDYPTQYYAIKTLPDNLQSQIVNIPLDYNPMVKIQGKVYKNVQKDLEGLNKSAVIAYDNTAQKVLDGTTTNSDGTYVLPSVPFSQVQNLVFYAAPFNESTKVIDQKFTTPNYTLSAATAQNNPITQDMNYGKTPVDIVYGQALLSETGKAVANAIIYYDDVRIGQTSEDGFFAFKMSTAQKDPKNFKIVCNSKVLDPNQTISIVETAFSKWAQQVQPNAYNKANLNKNKPNSALLNHFVTYAKQYDDRNARTISILVDTTLEKLGNYYLANCTLKYTFYNKLMATYRGVKQTVLVKDLEENVIVPMNMADTTLLLSPDIDRYQVSISPAPNQTPFVEIKNSVINFSPSTPSVIVVLTPLVKITGTVTAKLSNKPLDSATIKVDRLNAQTVSNTEGVFEVVFGETAEAKLTISREGYFAKDTIIKFDNESSKTITIQLEAAPGIPIGQLAGFDAEITRQVYIKDSTYKVWGRIQLNPNGIFSLDDQAANLTFNNILVHVGQDGNARPLVDSLTFAESQVNGKMYDFAPIDIRKIQLKKKLEVRQFSRGVITGLVTVKASTFPSINKSFPLTFGDATLQIPDKFIYIYLFTSDKQKVSALDEESMAFYLKFNQADQGYVKSPFLKTGHINVSQDCCVIAKNGMSLKGNVTLPSTIFAKNSNVSFKDLLIDNQLNFTDNEINLSRAPLSVGVKKWRLGVNGNIVSVFVVGNFNNIASFKANDIDIVLETPAFVLALRVKLELIGDKIGVKGTGDVKLGGITLSEAAFHYYKSKRGGISIGAEVKVRLGIRIRNPEPFIWYNIGGGFNYNSTNRDFEAYFIGDGGPYLTEKSYTPVYLDIPKLSIFFEGACNGKPILKGEARVSLRKLDGELKEVGSMYAEVDFCKGILYVNVKANLDGFIPGVEARVDGVLYVAAGTEGVKGMVLLAVNGYVKAGSFLEANGTIALGVNFDVNTPLPANVKTIFHNLPNEAKYDSNKKMEAFYVGVNRTTSLSSKASFDAGPASVSLEYSMNNAIDANLLANFATNVYQVDYGIYASFSGRVAASLFEVGISAGLSAYGSARLYGGYGDTDGLNVRGMLRGGFQVETGNCFAKCNTMCGSLGVFSASLGAKACVSFKVDMGWSVKRGFSLYSFGPD